MEHSVLYVSIFQTCQRNRSIKVALIDHISGPAATVFPVKKIASALKDLDVVLIVDAAHAPGQVNVDLVSNIDGRTRAAT